MQVDEQLVSWQVMGLDGFGFGWLGNRGKEQRSQRKERIKEKKNKKKEKKKRQERGETEEGWGRKKGGPYG